MKSYCSKGQLRLTGKAWQIRHLLQRWHKDAHSDILLKDWIEQQIS